MVSINEINMKVCELIEKLQEFNPMAEVFARADDRRISVSGIYSWSSAPGDNPRDYDMAKSKMHTPRVTLDTDGDDIEVICND